MRKSIVLACGALAAASVARAHGPQIQTTAAAGKIVTRELIQDGPYSGSLTNPKSVYVMPMAEYLGMTQSHPNDDRLPDNNFEFPSGPGFAYGYGYDATTNPAALSGGIEVHPGLRGWTESVERGGVRRSGRQRTECVPRLVGCPIGAGDDN